MQEKITDTETKITQEKIKSIKENFAASAEACLSAERLAEYDGSAAAHGANMAKIGELMPLLGTLEIALRNLADALVAARTGDAEWLLGFADEKIAKTRADLAKNLSKTPRHSEILSNLTLGSWVFIIDHFRLAEHFFATIELGRYSEFNTRKRLRKLSRVDVSQVCLKLLLTIRNRAAHFEHLGKMRAGRSNINKNHNGAIVNVDPPRLRDFLRDLIACINAELLATLPEKFR